MPDRAIDDQPPPERRKPGRPSMGRRNATAIRLDADLHARLGAVARFLDRLIPVADWKLTTDD